MQEIIYTLIIIIKIYQFTVNAEFKTSIVGKDKPDSSPTGKFFNKTFYNPDLDYEEELNSHIKIYGREEPDQLDYGDVWESAY